MGGVLFSVEDLHPLALLCSLDVLSHKRLLDEARADPTAVSFAVRPVEIIVPKVKETPCTESPCSPQVGVAAPHSPGTAMPCCLTPCSSVIAGPQAPAQQKHAAQASLRLVSQFTSA